MGATPAVTGRPSAAQAMPVHPHRHLSPTAGTRTISLLPSPTLAAPRQLPPLATVDPRNDLGDEHAVLLWQTCAYVEDFADAARTGLGHFQAFDVLLRFLHYRLLPYLSAEEQQLAGGVLPPADRVQQIIDHYQIREAVEAIEAAETEAGALFATNTLVGALDQHVRGEESWTPQHSPPTPQVSEDTTPRWALPLLLTDDIDLDALPPGSADTLVLTRLQRMRCGETVRVRSRRDLDSLWQQLRTRLPGEHAWAYETTEPENWVACITRREADFS